MTTQSYILIPSIFGTLVLFWQDTEQGPMVRRVLLPSETESVESQIQASYADSRPGSCQSIDDLGHQIGRFFEGEDLVFPLHVLALHTCSAFQQRVLVAEHGIPRGWVSSYGRLARQVGAAGGARAAGNALANNPFPILIPCHRAIRANGDLGGYQGGLEMKRALLKMEGIQVSAAGRVLVERFYYTS